MTGVRNISRAGRMEMKVSETPPAPSKAARGVILRMTGPTKPPIISTNLNEHPRQTGFPPLIGSPVLSAIGSMMTNVTMNMCGTLMPDGSAQDVG